MAAQERRVARINRSSIKNDNIKKFYNEDVAARVLDVAPSTIYYKLEIIILQCTNR